jgi:glycerophosphoryl diester phosphodiesterase
LTGVVTPAPGQLLAETGYEIFAHRGFSGRYPESTPAAYTAAIEYAAATGIELGLECDVHFTADDHLICLHDLTVDRTSTQTGPAFERTLAELRTVDFGSRFKSDATPDEKSIITLVELLDLIADARARGVAITLNLETKHPNPRGLEIEDRVAELLADRGWDGADSPIRLITFSLDALARMYELLPKLRRTYLVSRLSGIEHGVLPDGVSVVGPDIALLRNDPGFVERVRSHGNEVHAWTVNTPEDTVFCRNLGVTGFTTDVPDVVVDTLTSSAASS